MGKSSGVNYVQFRGQKFSQIRKQHVDVKVAFCDPLFPPDSSSIGSFNDIPQNIEWKRPKDLCESPRLIDGELRSETIVRGRLSFKWFVSACSILAGIPELCHKVIPDYWKQEWDYEKKDNYVGLFHFHFWRFGQWVDVVIDDLLPTMENKILSTHTKNTGEFWISLIEKAYAKLHGSYEALKGGQLSDALVDFTGGVSEIVDLKSGDYRESSEEQATLFAFLVREMNHHCIVCATVSVCREEDENARTDSGLYQGETYMVTAVRKVSVGDTSLRTLFKGRVKHKMVRLCDPYQRVHSSAPAKDGDNEPEEDGLSSGRGSSSCSGKSTTHKDPLYSTSKLSRLLSLNPEWATVKDSDLDKIGLTCDHAGEFWVPLEDFVKNFSHLTVCHLFNTNIFALNKTWKEASFRGLWSTGAKGTQSDRAGGCSSFSETFLRNPQYIFDVKQFEEEIIVQMLQWDASNTYQAAGEESLLIAFYIIKVEENRKYRLHKLWQHTPIIVSFNPIRKREVFYRGSLTRGRYILIPTTHKPGDIGGYFLRLFSSTNLNMKCVKKDTPSKPWFCCSTNYPIWASVITIKGGEDLKQPNSVGSTDPFCIIKCERQKAKTHLAKNASHPNWDSSFVFYRKKTNVPIVIQVYYHKVIVPNIFAGQVLLPCPVNQRPTPLNAELMNKDINAPTPTQGVLVLEIFTTDNFLEL